MKKYPHFQNGAVQTLRWQRGLGASVMPTNIAESLNTLEGPIRLKKMENDAYQRNCGRQKLLLFWEDSSDVRKLTPSCQVSNTQGAPAN